MIRQTKPCAFTLAAALSFAAAGQATAEEQGTTTQQSYVGELEYQGQSITHDTAAFLHKRLLQQRATQLVTWAMPMMNFEQLYPALLQNMGFEDDGSIFFGLYDGSEKNDNALTLPLGVGLAKTTVMGSQPW